MKNFIITLKQDYIHFIKLCRYILIYPNVSQKINITCNTQNGTLNALNYIEWIEYNTLYLHYNIVCLFKFYYTFKSALSSCDAYCRLHLYLQYNKVECLKQ